MGTFRLFLGCIHVVGYIFQFVFFVVSFRSRMYAYNFTAILVPFGFFQRRKDSSVSAGMHKVDIFVTA